MHLCDFQFNDLPEEIEQTFGLTVQPCYTIGWKNATPNTNMRSARNFEPGELRAVVLPPNLPRSGLHWLDNGIFGINLAAAAPRCAIMCFLVSMCGNRGWQFQADVVRSCADEEFITARFNDIFLFVRVPAAQALGGNLDRDLL